jgi:hypothetical protein
MDFAIDPEKHGLHFPPDVLRLMCFAHTAARRLLVGS